MIGRVFLMCVIFALTSLGFGEMEEPALVEQISSKMTDEVRPEKKSFEGHSMFSDWFKVFHRFDQFQTYPRMTHNLLMDIKETDDYYVIEVDVPGIEKEGIKVAISPNQQELQITAYKKGLKIEKGEEVKMVERVTGQLNRIVYLPDSADVDNLRATYQNGVLAITMPKFKLEDPEHTRYIIVE